MFTTHELTLLSQSTINTRILMDLKRKQVGRWQIAPLVLRKFLGRIAVLLTYVRTIVTDGLVDLLT